MIPLFTDGFFQIDSEHGFLPIQDPLERLPETYDRLQNILENLSSYLMDCSIDHLSEELRELPNYSDQVNGEENIHLIVALYRGYCFLASAYLLYPSYVHFRIHNEYGLGRDRLPISIAQPLVHLADRLEVFPFLEYSYGYSLGNYVRKDKSGDLRYENLGMANHFSGTSDECGFIMVHVDINQYTPGMIHACDTILESRHRDEPIGESLKLVVDVLTKMNASRRKMWDASRWKHYNDFRVYIMGIKGNTSMFPNGVIYEPETEPRFYRGQSGSQDSIIPFLDTFFRVCDNYPTNELTSYLMDMRSYRPKPFRELISWIGEHTTGIVDWMIAKDTSMTTCSLLVQVYKQIYDFRNGHWQFVQKYIMANTNFPVATGGTPIVSWLPNQIGATLQAMRRVLDIAKEKGYVDEDSALWASYEEEYQMMMALLKEQIAVLSSPQPYNPHCVYSLNSVFRQSDCPKVQ